MGLLLLFILGVWLLSKAICDGDDVGFFVIIGGILILLPFFMW